MHVWSAVLWYDDIRPKNDEAVGLARLIWQYRGEQPRLQGGLSAFLRQLQSIDDVSMQVLTEVWPLTAVGVQLDILGKIVCQKRLGLGDEAYRRFLLGRIFVNKANCRWEEFFDLLVNILDADDPVAGYEFRPSAMRIAATGMAYPSVVGDLLFDMKPGGVRLDYVHSTRVAGTLFRTSSLLGTDQASTTEGTTNLAGTSGGYLCSFRCKK